MKCTKCENIMTMTKSGGKTEVHKCLKCGEVVEVAIKKAKIKRKRWL